MVSIELHVVRFYPPSNPNRGFDARPKSCVVGGVERCRHSSQSQKAVIRDALRNDPCLSGKICDPSRQHWRLLSDALQSLCRNLDVEQVEGLAKAVMADYTRSDGNDGCSKQIIHLGGVHMEAAARVLVDNYLAKDQVRLLARMQLFPEQPKEFGKVMADAMKVMADAMKAKKDDARLTHLKDNAWHYFCSLQEVRRKKLCGNESAPTKKGAQELLKMMLEDQDFEYVTGLMADVRVAVEACITPIDTLIMGRFAQPDILAGVDSCMFVSEEFGLSVCQITVDEFTTRDFLSQLAGEAGAGYKSGSKRPEKFLVSDVKYGFRGIDLVKLAKNFDGREDVEALHAALRDAIDGMLLSVPMGMFNSSGQLCLPESVLAIAREDGHAYNFAAAFQFPLSSAEPMGVEASRRLSQYYDRARKNLGTHQAAWFSTQHPFLDRELKERGSEYGVERFDSLDDLSKWCFDNVVRLLPEAGKVLSRARKAGASENSSR